MKDNDTKRLSRLTAILTQLQSKRLITATSLAEKFNVSVRTIYRDMKALEHAGVPLFTEEGRGYSVMEGYRIPPIMFTEREAYALMTAEQIILKHKDASFIKEFTEAVSKIKAVLRHTSKENVETLEKRMYIGKNFENEITSRHLIDIQFTITNYQLVKINYQVADGSETERIIEPFSLYHNPAEDWTLAAYCRLRKDFRSFRLDRIKRIAILNERFSPHDLTIYQFAERFLSF